MCPKKSCPSEYSEYAEIKWTRHLGHTVCMCKEQPGWTESVGLNFWKDVTVCFNLIYRNSVFNIQTFYLIWFLNHRSAPMKCTHNLFSFITPLAAPSYCPSWWGAKHEESTFMVFILDGCSFHMRTHGVNQEFRFDQGIWLHRKSGQFRFFYRKILFCVRNVFWATIYYENHSSCLCYHGRIPV